MNVDPQEVHKFDAMAARWWDKKGSCKALHDINPVRLQFVENHLDLQDAALLDIGCGGGIFSEALADKGAKVTGIDLSKQCIDVAKLHALESGLSIDYQQASAEAWAEKHAGQFDIVTCMELIEHVPDPQSLIKACATLVRPGGHLFFSSLNRNVKSYLLAIVAAEYVFNLLPKGTHEHAQFVKPSELSSWIRQAGLTMKAVAGMSYHVLSKAYTLSQDLSVNYLVYAVR
jgi:2-polyprenyl-6-hydroxyphenyl methylase / 3-demethylubiquinone-9 3-methyltransferase